MTQLQTHSIPSLITTLAVFLIHIFRALQIMLSQVTGRTMRIRVIDAGHALYVRVVSDLLAGYSLHRRRVELLHSIGEAC